MGIVRFALRLPHTFYVLAALILFLGGIAIRSMPTDIFPEIRIPVVTVIWRYTGLSTPEMEQRVSTYSQYSISANVTGIKNIEAQTLNGLSVQKIYFQPDVNLDLAISQIVSATNAIRALMPPGIQPPIIVQFNASSVPVLQLSLESNSLNEQQLYDFGIYRVRQQLAPVPGVTLPTPAGGKYRQIMVDIDPNKLLSRGLTPLDIVNAVNTQNLTLPTGTTKIGDTQYTVRTNATPATIQDLNMIPVKFANGATIFLKDVAQVRDGAQVQQNIVREDGHRAVLLSVIKNGNASTLAVVNGVKAALTSIRASAPAGLKINELFDQSIFVTHSVNGVLREGAIAAGLTALMILVFLGSWRSTLVVLISIPLAMLSSLVVLYFLGETLNTMTLGGLALAVGILVDDSTVTIENTPALDRRGHAVVGSDPARSRRDRYSDVGLHARDQLRVHLGRISGRPGQIFVQRRLASPWCSRCWRRTDCRGRSTPITIGLLLKGERRHGEGERSSNIFARASAAFERGFEHLRDGYSDLLLTLLRRRVIVPVVAVLVLALGATMFVYVGRDFYPLIDGGQIQLHVRAPAGTRIERTEAIFQAVEDKIREVIPKRDRALIVDNIGLPARPYNLAFTDGSTIGVNDGTILVSLKDGHKPTADYIRKLRQVLPSAFPEDTFYFQAADIVTQILNFGLPAQIDVRTVGYGSNNLAVAKELQKSLAAIPGVVDAHLQQEVDAPAFYADIDRTRAAQLGLNASTVATNINVSLSSSAQVSPNFWTDPTSGIPYYLAVQTPEYRANSLNSLGNTPVSASLAASGQTVPGLLSNVATFKRGTVPTNLNQANVQPVFDVYASVQGRDLGSVASDIDKVTSTLQKQLQPGNSIQVLGQIQSMHQSFRDLGIGLLFAAILVYLLMVVNYQNFGDPFVVIMALPATFCGIVTMLFVTGTTLNVPSLMGAIMAVGVASANSILLVTFARDEQLKGHSAFQAALSAGRTRIRPVLKTAAAMIVGMIPMAIGGPGEEQNAALARAVIGGLLFATPTTLLIVPYLFAMLRKGNDGKPRHGVFEEQPE
uniref:RagC n=1 Tax=Bradyrhizobium japonicum TaxID=375 RepID=O69238_BRAJP|nr:RagC [Bradyrhizobium japonicum]